MSHFLGLENCWFHSEGSWHDAESVINSKFQVNRFLGGGSHGYAQESQLALNTTDFETIMRQ